MAEYSTRDLAAAPPSAALFARAFDNNDRRPPAAASFARDNNARTLPIATISDNQPSPAAAAAADKKIVIKSADMKEDMQKEAIDCAVAAFEKLGVEKEIAEHIKKEFDRKHGPTWHCIVGRNFGSYVTHETNHFIYFYLESKAILLFKSG